ncbi:uncharacterized protein LACBIDRAFT_325951 [Laccaria bicolor S238N-H82]|uniref:Predicted protein n=1 Tax=Laccaria bicolor (strain S238N-H82 / ATCC MYA-4686) TaxID=486041 RepID=B0D6S9_LACBS|nr:uncharacterized protein LACBIDRAFT_325951 [Laccaria bicolor S238N-H82]EDR09276.1 predicted protein [Laccaria bicolor S238N-H82]|eukprot:XP_001879625.1 predicted protein [Laccaria bicolor S238N-H82]
MELHTARRDDPSPYCHSQSLACLLDPFFASHEWPEVMFCRMLKDESAKITYMESTWFAPGFAWNTEFLETAYIFLPDVERFQEPHLSPTENAATFCTSYLARINDLLHRPHVMVHDRGFYDSTSNDASYLSHDSV